tara:strand:+ start:1810 stop:2922 length:1113 start_codon:yes stop_codon:yes gene_type:complete
MPRGRKGSSGKYELRKRNDISLRDDESLDETPKVLKIGEYNSPLEISNSELKINGDLFLEGKLKSHIIQTDNDYLDFKSGYYFRFYTQDTTSGNESTLNVTSTGNLLWTSAADYNISAQGDIDMTAKGDDFHFRGDGSNPIDYFFNYDLSNYALLTVADSGVTSLSTADGDGTVGHLTLQPNGDLILDPDSNKTIINATDGLYFDGGTHTYLYESGDDVLRVVVGADILMQFSEKGDDGNEISFGETCVGFSQLEPTYNSSTTNVDFRHSNKQFLTFGSGNITSINCIFPLVSGNFVLLLKQDGTGSRTVTNWKAAEFDESAADGSSTIKFAGGSNPTLTTDANHVDIISFYWDADNEIAYGVATLDFQF